MAGPTDDIEIITLTEQEWDCAVRNTLREAGLTYDQLAEQARTGDFASLRARKLWLTVHGVTWTG